jgi:hypothetical protein
MPGIRCATAASLPRASTVAKSAARGWLAAICYAVARPPNEARALFMRIMFEIDLSFSPCEKKIKNLKKSVLLNILLLFI